MKNKWFLLSLFIVIDIMVGLAVLLTINKKKEITIDALDQ